MSIIFLTLLSAFSFANDAICEKPVNAFLKNMGFGTLESPLLKKEFVQDSSLNKYRFGNFKTGAEAEVSVQDPNGDSYIMAQKNTIIGNYEMMIVIIDKSCGVRSIDYALNHSLAVRVTNTFCNEFNALEKAEPVFSNDFDAKVDALAKKFGKEVVVGDKSNGGLNLCRLYKGHFSTVEQEKK